MPCDKIYNLCIVHFESIRKEAKALAVNIKSIVLKTSVDDYFLVNI